VWTGANLPKEEVLEEGMGLSLRIRQARRRSRMSQEQLACMLGVTRGAVANWESIAAVAPSSQRLGVLARCTGVSYEWLATGRGQMVFVRAEEGERPSAWVAESPEEARLIMRYRTGDATIRQVLMRIAEVEG